MCVKKLFPCVLLTLISVFLLVIPKLFWGSLLNVGGDDGKLYYLFPFQYFKYFSLSLISDNSLGALGFYFPQSYSAPFAVLLTLLKNLHAFFNLEQLLFGLNLAGGFLGLYLLTGLWIKNVSNSSYIRMSAALFYVFSTFSIYTVWNNELFSVYLVSLFPIALYLFCKAAIEEKYIYVVLGVLVTTLFSIVLLSPPWLIALSIAALPLLFCVFLQHTKSFLKSGALWIVLTVLLNLFWIVPFIYSPFSSDKAATDVTSSISGVSFRQVNQDVVLGVSEHNSILYPLFALFHKQLQIDYSWPTYKIYESWSATFLPLNLVFLLIIVCASFVVQKSSREDQKLYTASLFSWLLILFLFTVHIGSWGESFFIWLNNTVPGFVMFRNMFDKFGVALAFSYAMLLAFSMKIVFDAMPKANLKVHVQTLIQKGILSAIALITIASAIPFILGRYYLDPIWTTKDTYNSISAFNTDFDSLLAYLQANHEPSRYLWLPLNDASYVQIQDAQLTNHYYSGVSPLEFLAQTSDYTGFLSFGTYDDELRTDLLTKNYVEFASILQKLNVQYIIVNNSLPTDIQNSYLYSLNTSGDLYAAQQDPAFKRILLGKKIENFGTRYSLFAINPKFENEKIYLTQDITKFPTNFSQVTYTKKASYEYMLTLNHLSGTEYLVFLDPYHKLWELRTPQDGKVFMSGSHNLVFNYANGWEISTQQIEHDLPKKDYTVNPDGSITISLELYFAPESYFLFEVATSSIVLAGCIAYSIYILFRRRKNYEHIT
jgi:hypothetical protein